ncbi:hypothetical protein DRQ53_03755 [bacterium]|nr:MAG: hypothetical protein DRQ53_03755 [bacterium]
MSLIRRRLRPLRLLLAGLFLFAACSRPPAIYSRHPVDEQGTPFSQQRLTGLELVDHTRYELREGESLQIESDFLIIRGRVRTDGSRRQRAIELDEVELLRVRHEDGREAWYPVATPNDLAELDVLPRLELIILNNGEEIVVDRDTKARWSASRLEILVGPEGVPDSALRVVSLDEIELIRVTTTSALRSTVLSPKFWIVAGVAVGLAWFAATRADSDNTAVE